MRGWKTVGLLLLLGALLSLSAFPQPVGLPVCVHQGTSDGSLHWRCSGEGLMGELTQMPTTFDGHLTTRGPG